MRILVIEDEKVFLETMTIYLKKLGYAVDAVETLADADEYLYINTYDLILLDVNLPDGNGFAFCKALREQSIETPVLLVTARDEVHDRISGLDSGADDYIVKPFAFDELRARIQAVFRRVKNKTLPELTLGDIRLIPHEFKVQIQGEDIAFYAKEYEILYHLFMTHPTPQSIESVIEHVWDEDANPFSNSARVHITNIRKKLATHSQAVELKNKSKVGYYLWVH